jgi:allantoinase
MLHALRSRRVITPQGERDAVVIIEDGLITGVVPSSPLASGISHLPLEDLGDCALLPGLVDAHTHINEPGRTDWEGFATATRAAAAGGFTTLVDMPLNCLPETTDPEALELKRAAAFGSAFPNTQHPTSNIPSPNQCLVDLAFWGGAVDGNQAELEPLALAGVPGFKCFLIYPGCDGFTEIDRANLELAIPHIARTGLPLLVHAELATPIDAAVARLNADPATDWRRYSTYLASRPDQAELEAIELLITLCRAHRFRLHIVHLSTARALPLIAAARQEGLPLTVETCPHYLHFAAEDISDGNTLAKCAPPIRSRDNREQLWQALQSGLIDLIATDHSPCPPHMKRLAPTTPGGPSIAQQRVGSELPQADSEAQSPGLEYGRFDQAWGGIPSLSTALPVLWTGCTARNIPLTRLANWTSLAPAHLAGIATQVGSIEPGKHANLVAFDPDATLTVTRAILHYRHPISPYMGQTLRGVVRSTWLRGTRVFDNRGATPLFPVPPAGREYTLDSQHTP